jgi:1,4-dihydroxy-2-naphthoate octaprenyltransferase
MNASRKYGLLRTIAFVLKVLAWVVLAVGLIGMLVSLARTGSPDPLGRALASLAAIILPVTGIVWFVQLFAIGSILSLLVDIEENTRLLAER